MLLHLVVGITNVDHAGLRPHHNAGAVGNNLFRHRYQSYDAASNQLTYYQFDVKRHDHVVMLADVGLQSCKALKLGVELVANVAALRAANITQGARRARPAHEC